MECNKEEAIRAKSIAESRMQKKDFEGARIIAMKAQRLFPDLESISQILAVCEVHCAAESKMAGGTDWYAILQLEMTADESTIKKQFRKFALLLHPDKNKLAGAEGAFQHVGDAYKILSDPAKRLQYDMIRRANFSGRSLNLAARKSYRPSTKKQPGPGVSNMAAKSSFSHFSCLNKDQSTFLSAGVFWTMCPSCSGRFQYHQNNLNKQVCCKKCFNTFFAYALKTHDEPTTENLEKDGNSAPLTGAKSHFVNASTMEFQRAKPDDPAINQGDKLECSSEFFNKSKDNIRDDKVNDDSINCNDIKFQKVKLQPIHNGEKMEKTQASQNRSSNEVNLNAESSVDRTNILRRSSRHKQNAISDEVQDACMFSPPPPSKRLRKGEKQVHKVQTNTAFPGVSADGEREENENSRIHSGFNASLFTSCKASVDSENLSYNAPEFYDFESERCESKFAVNQIWALYDNLDGMPRYYARVKKVFTRGFNLELSWLDNDPRSIDEMKWSEQGLPVSCGSFKLGKSFSTREKNIFSHLVSWRKGMKRNSYVIYPRKGEIWALFSDWDFRWIWEPDNHRVYKYQVVEVVSDFTEIAGISVVRLAKIKEFMALFIRATDAEESLLEIPAKDVLMFSHRIPACRMTGKQGSGVPEGAFELDCASLPANFKATFPFISNDSAKSRKLNVGAACNSVCADSKISENKTSQPTMKNGIAPSIEHNATEKSRSEARGSPFKKLTSNSNVSKHTFPPSKKDAEGEMEPLINEAGADADNICSQNPNTEHHNASPNLLSFEYPESEFYEFENDRLMEKFECGQVWAFYCEIDNFPKYYGRIKGVDQENSKVHVRWLGVYSGLDEEGDCGDGKPPPACGTFKAVKETCTMDSVEAFSHLVKAKPMKTKDHYYIFPGVGEVWAVFRNWNSSWSAYELRNSEFDIVEISACDDSETKVLLLTKVDGYVSIFRRESEDRDAVKLIPVDKWSSFSHRIPAYRLTKEAGSGVYWELDPAAVPIIFLTSKP